MEAPKQKYRLMKKEIDMNEISDGRLYGLNDMVKADCQDCQGCWDCCMGMGDSILLDPLDVHRIRIGTGLSVPKLLEEYLGLTVVDGIVLPHLKLEGTGESCKFLNSENRCSIHDFRPGICRLFPLGRIYENHSVQYFLQTRECKKQNRGKVKVKKWLGVTEARRYEQFIVNWHYFLTDLQEEMEHSGDGEFRKKENLRLLENFYLMAYETESDFYAQFYDRLKRFGSGTDTLRDMY